MQNSFILRGDQFLENDVQCIINKNEKIEIYPIKSYVL